MNGLNKNTSTLNYWDNIHFVPNYTPEDKYILFDQYEGGFSNVRMCYEIACVLAYALNRKLVVPPPRHIYLLNSPDLHLSSFFDINNLVVSHVDYNEFIHTHTLDSAYTIPNISYQTLYRLDAEAPDVEFTGDIVKLDELDNKQILYFPKNLFGNFYNVIQTSRMNELCRYVAKHLHYKSTIFEDAKQCIDIMGDLEYYAIHVRRGDFNAGWLAKEVVLPAETILENIQYALPTGCKLYIATDETDKSFFNSFREKYDVYFYDDIKVKDMPADFIGITEQIICARAISFIGSFASTFSSYITRLRGYMPEVFNKEVITFSKKYDPSYKDNEEYKGIFVREYSTGWRF